MRMCIATLVKRALVEVCTVPVLIEIELYQYFHILVYIGITILELGHFYRELFTLCSGTTEVRWGDVTYLLYWGRAWIGFIVGLL